MTNDEAILGWFTGKARQNAQLALRLLNDSIAQGSWIPRASVKVRAAFSKPSVIIKLARLHKATLEPMGFELRHAMQFGGYERAAERIDFSALRAAVAPDQENTTLKLNLLNSAERWIRDFAEVAVALAKLDATRPKPVFTKLGVSPTLTATLENLGVAGSLDTVRVCPIEWIEIEVVKNGKKSWKQVGRLVWPANTRHNTSKHAWAGQRFTCCEACGHAIRNPFNWVPMLVDDADGIPRSLWTGRDCAESLFGIKMTGELELSDGPDAAGAE